MPNQTLGTRELWERFKVKPLEIYKEESQRMQDAGIEEAPTLSRVLEEVSPTEKGDNLDAFERLLMEAGIRTQSDPLAGYWASKAGAFEQNQGTRALFTEFFARNWRKVSFGQHQERAILLSDGTVGSWERPYADAMAARPSRRIEPAIPLSELVAMTTPISGDAYRSWYMTYDAAQLRQFRVGESAEIPIATIVGNEHTVRLKKYGRGLRISYEELRRARVDKLAFYIQWMAVQSEIDKVAAALAILVAGDGNANTAATETEIVTLDATATNDVLTLKAWLAFKMLFEQPYMVTTALMRSDVALQLAMLNTGSANVPLANVNLGGLNVGITPINQTADNVRYGWTSEAPAGKIVAFDNRFALERVTEIGAEISEMERYITNQTQVFTMTEVEGYAILDSNSVRVLDTVTP
jgi:hypothetical protein